MKRRMVAAAAALLACMPAAHAQAPQFDAAPWLEDVEQVRVALKTRYANREWLEKERGIAIDPLMDRIAAAARTAGSDAAMRALLDQLVRRIGDGHVALRWPRATQPAAAPSASAAAGPATPAQLCARIGYAARRASSGIAPSLAGYRALDGDNPIPAGLVEVAGKPLGVVVIGFFDPHAFPALCTGAVARLGIPLDRDCDDQCQGAIVTDAFAHLTMALEERLHALRAAGATALMVDLTGNGGGSEWAEAAARALTSRRLVSARLGFVRGAHWAKQWRDLAERLRSSAESAEPADRAKLLQWAKQAEAARVEAETPCDPASGCAWLGTAGYATGLVGSAADGEFLDKPWGAYVFSAGQHAYRSGSWSGPLIVLTDNETWSAAEEFAAMLQDNRAAVVLGSRTGGAGCGHTWGGTPVTLAHSGAVLELPDCVRFRADGSNEVAGVIPDVLIGWRANDGTALRARLLAAALPEAVTAAQRLMAEAPGTR